MSLVSLVDDLQTDKNTLHSYLDTYETLMSSKKNSAKNILEIGIYTGGSIELWNQYFPNATIYGIDINPHFTVTVPGILTDPRNKLFLSTNGYNDVFFNNTFLNKVSFDFIIDDGPHTLESMKKCISLYTHVLADDGILIIEDIQSFDWIAELRKVVPPHLSKYIEVYDLRKNKGRYDDIMFVINKSLKH